MIGLLECIAGKSDSPFTASGSIVEQRRRERELSTCSDAGAVMSDKSGWHIPVLQLNCPREESSYLPEAAQCLWERKTVFCIYLYTKADPVTIRG
ncbi:hypothetical protein XELAEV_18045555mg [Xenopus laevis]|uniref:Uncharacterized protein n=1 Tax=Xenopus laevis TaxID=8355 RepID=A0A974H4R3_XENLA|nr:hypothetical protein XELAEV_18045555mg [Xenopus laevis]